MSINALKPFYDYLNRNKNAAIICMKIFISYKFTIWLDVTLNRKYTVNVDFERICCIVRLTG